jgi:myo-inositol-1(or 4)-monophosphatase
MFDRLDLSRAASLVRQAARDELMPRFQHVAVQRKQDGSLLTEADLAVQDRLERDLNAHWPGVALLGEEMSEALQRAVMSTRSSGIWVLDPLDGTGNFANGIPCFGVSLALLDADGIAAGIVYDPVRDECFSALRGAGAWLGEAVLRAPPGPASLADCMALVDFKRLPAPLVEALAAGAPYRSQRSFGSVALDWCWIATGRCQVYLHGGQRLWDYAAGVLILRESGGAGGLLEDYTGEWCEPTGLGARIGLAACDEALLQRWRHWLLRRPNNA